MERIGTSLGGFEFTERIGHGATGVVYGATRKGESFAVKVLSRDLANTDVLTKRFEREARVLRKLEHPGIVRIVAAGIEGDDVYIAMERLKGQTLEERLQEQRIEGGEALSIMKQVLLAVSHAHDNGIAHRDLKPANVFLVDSDDGEPQVRVLDFGLAKFLSHDEANAEGTLTRKGRVVGTPAYMAPEQITGVAVDARVDVYAAGIMLYEMIADQRPFTDTKRSQLLRAHLFDEVPLFEEISRSINVHEKLEHVVREALAKDPAKRFPTARAFYAALGAFDDSAIEVDSKRSDSRNTAGTNSVVIDVGEREEAEIRAKPGAWRQSAWVTALVWVVGLGLFAGVVGTMVYSGVVLR